MGLLIIFFTTLITLVAQVSGMEWQDHWLGHSWADGWLTVGCVFFGYILGRVDGHKPNQ